ncbi:MAG: M15 family metallopeptidase [Candidatus Omnitrophica bacterium]|nr:M15 family metallopeptidase [Candidatus Omnitrophota bacterium]
MKPRLKIYSFLKTAAIFMAVMFCFQTDLYAADSDLIQISSLDPSITKEIKYATEDNFMKEVLYDFDDCVLRRGTAQKLVNANRMLQKSGYKIKVFDCYRPLAVQRKMYARYPLKGFVADPARGSNHNRGAAVDCTIVKLSGEAVEMPSEYDEFSERSYHNYPAQEPMKTHRKILRDAMVQSGFTTISKEWWHYDDSDIAAYSLEEYFPEEFR